MATNRLAGINKGFVLLGVVIALGVLGDGVVVVTHLRSATSQAPSTTAQAGSKQAGAHPCNHGFYVSQAAHAKKGGAYVKQVAQSNLGKNGNCSAPLPAPSSDTKSSSDEADN